MKKVKNSFLSVGKIVLLGYSIPPDDSIWQHAFAEGIRSRIESENKAFCSVVVGDKGEAHWIYSKENVRAWTGGIPQVFGNCTETDVKELFYSDFSHYRS